MAAHDRGLLAVLDLETARKVGTAVLIFSTARPAQCLILPLFGKDSTTTLDI